MLLSYNNQCETAAIIIRLITDTKMDIKCIMIKEKSQTNDKRINEFFKKWCEEDSLIGERKLDS